MNKSSNDGYGHHSYHCSEGLILPWADERNWDESIRAFLYLWGLLYSFMGLAIGAEVFMTAIHRITTTKRRIRLTPEDIQRATNDEADDFIQEGSHFYKEVPIWNPTVANLSLMALGSSAPEILLSTIETCGSHFESSDLGPGAIVGAAAYNLFCGTAVCMLFLPTGETRRICQFPVFIYTAVVSIVAYLWLLVVLLGFSPHVIEVWEACITFAFFGIFIVAAWAIDVKFWKRLPGLRPASATKIYPANSATAILEMNGLSISTISEGYDKQPANKEILGKLRNNPFGAAGNFSVKEAKQFEEVRKDVMAEFPEMSVEEMVKVIAQRLTALEPKDALDYRIAATKWFTGGNHAAREEPEHVAEKVCFHVSDKDNTRRPSAAALAKMSENKLRRLSTIPPAVSRYDIIEFSAKRYGFTAACTSVKLRIVRRGNKLNKRVLVSYRAVSGSAKQNEGFMLKSETVVFLSKETEKIVSIEIDPAFEWTDDAAFYVKLALEEADDERTKIGSCHPAEVHFAEGANSSIAATFEFERCSVSCKESEELVRVPVIRHGDATTSVAVNYDTQDIEATEGADYIGGPGQIFFEVFEMIKFIDVQIIDDDEIEKAERFLIHLKSALPLHENEADLGEHTTAIVTIIDDSNVRQKVRQLHRLVPFMLKSFKPEAKSWKEQFIEAATISQCESRISSRDLLLHLVSLPWKVVFAMIPPCSWFGGWLAFVCSLTAIGILVAIVGDMAIIFGCLVGLKDVVTAITILAVGASFPDTLASVIAASADATADNAIGNITGSNSVNVFLGLGIPWLIASIYHRSNESQFIVNAGDLGFAVLLYAIAAIICVAILVARRKMAIFGRAELGGPFGPKMLCAGVLFSLWLLYIILASLQAYDHIATF